MQLSFLRRILFVSSLVCSVHTAAVAAKVDLFIGGFDFSAETSQGQGAASGFGLYKINYCLPVLTNVEVALGYTIILADTVGGDALFGFDIEMFYFPVTAAAPVRIRTESTFLSHESVWKPFVMVGYGARQIQSVSTQYNGISLGGGVERALNSKFNFKGLIRYLTMAGPNEGQATELGFMGGVSFSF